MGVTSVLLARGHLDPSRRFNEGYTTIKDFAPKFGIGLAALVFIGAAVVPANAETVPESKSLASPVQPSIAQIQEFAPTNMGGGRPWVSLSTSDRDVLRAKYATSGRGPVSRHNFSLETSEAWGISEGSRLLRIPVKSGQGVTDQVVTEGPGDSSKVRICKRDKGRLVG